MEAEEPVASTPNNQRMSSMKSIITINNRRGGETSSLPFYWWRYLLWVTLILFFGLSCRLGSQAFQNNDNYWHGGGISVNGDAPPAVTSDSSRRTNKTQMESQQPTKNFADVIDNIIVEQQQPAADVTKDEGNDRGESSFIVHREYLQHLRSLDPFPRKIHILFPRKDFYKRHDDRPPLNFVKNGILRFMELNPTWNVTVYDDADMDHIIRMAAGDGIISTDEMNILVGIETQPAAHPVERSDLARLLIIWYFGGMYVDVDSLINSRDFDKVFLTTVKMCLPTYLESNFAQSNICSSPKNRLYIDIINQMSEHRMKSKGGGPIERRGGWASKQALFAIGPPLFNRVIFSTVFGKSVTGHGTIPGMQDARKALKEQAGDLIVTGKWKSQCDSFIAAPFEGCAEWSRTELYNLYNMSRWGVAVDRRWGINA